MSQGNTFQFEEDPLSKKSQNIVFIQHGSVLLMQFLQTKPQMKSKNINFSHM